MGKDDSSTERKLNDRERKQMFYYNKTLKSLKQLKEGDTVFVRLARIKKVETSCCQQSSGNQVIWGNYVAGKQDKEKSEASEFRQQ